MRSSTPAYVTCRAVPYFSNPDVTDAQTGSPSGIGDTQHSDYYSVCLSFDEQVKRQIDDVSACPANVVSVFNHMAP